METTELTVFVEQSGIDKVKGNAITESLNIFFNKAQEWDATIQSIVINDISETGKMRMAREGRLTLKNLRLDSDKVVKAKRDEIKYRMANDLLEDKLWLKAGQMVEAVYKNLETKLEEKEKFAERKEAERKENIRIARVEKLKEYPEFDPQFTDLLNMPDVSFDQLISGLQIAKEKRIADEKAAELARIEKEKAEAVERARIKAENERLKKEAEEKEAALKIEREKAEAERRAAELKAAKERAVIEEKARKEREAAALRLKKEREEKEALEAQIRAKKQAEEKARREAELKAASELKAAKLAEKKAQAAPDKQKLIKFSADLLLIPFPLLKSDEGINILDEVKERIKNITHFIKKEIENI